MGTGKYLKAILNILYTYRYISHLTRKLKILYKEEKEKKISEEKTERKIILALRILYTVNNRTIKKKWNT